MPCFSRISPALIPSHVDAILIKMRSLLTPFFFSAHKPNTKRSGRLLQQENTSKSSDHCIRRCSMVNDVKGKDERRGVVCNGDGCITSVRKHGEVRSWYEAHLFLIESDNLVGLGDGRIHIERKAGIYLCANISADKNVLVVKRLFFGRTRRKYSSNIKIKKAELTREPTSQSPRQRPQQGVPSRQ
jgi:hypothetical protein